MKEVKYQVYLGESDEITRVSSEFYPFDHRMPVDGIRVHVLCPHCFTLPRRQTFVGLTFPLGNPLENFIHAMDQSTILYSFVSFLVLLISSVSSSNQNPVWGLS